MRKINHADVKLVRRLICVMTRECMLTKRQELRGLICESGAGLSLALASALMLALHLRQH